MHEHECQVNVILKFVGKFPRQPDSLRRGKFPDYLRKLIPQRSDKHNSIPPPRPFYPWRIIFEGMPLSRHNTQFHLIRPSIHSSSRKYNPIHARFLLGTHLEEMRDKYGYQRELLEAKVLPGVLNEAIREKLYIF